MSLKMYLIKDFIVPSDYNCPITLNFGMNVLQLSNYTTRTICIWLLGSIWNVLRAHLLYSPFWIEGFQQKKEKKLRVSIFFPTFGWQKRWKRMRICESQELLWSHFCLEEKRQNDFVRKHIPFYFFFYFFGTFENSLFSFSEIIPPLFSFFSHPSSQIGC